MPLGDAAADAVLALLATAKRPLVIGAPVLATAKGRDLLRRIESALTIPTCLSEGPRGFNDASLGAYAEVAKRADMVLLLGKALDFTLKFGGAPFPPDCRFIAIDPDGAILDRAARSRGLAFGCVADTYPAAEALIARGALPCRHGMAGGGAVLLRRPAGGMGRSGLENPGNAASGAGIPDVAAVP